MGIFDWHEDKTPEELAKELGISDLAAVENAGKQVVDIFKGQEGLKKLKEEAFGKETNFPSNNINDNSPEIENSELWSDDFVILNLRPGMVLNLMKLKLAYKILEVNEIGWKVTLTPIAKPLKLDKSFSELKQLFQVYKEDLRPPKPNFPRTKVNKNSPKLEDSNLWTDNYKIQHLKPGMKTMIETLNIEDNTKIQNIFEIAEVNYEKEIIEISNWIKQAINIKKTFSQFKKLCKIYKEDIESENSVYPSSSIENNSSAQFTPYVWTENYTTYNIKPGMKLKAKNGEEHLYKVLEVDWDINIMIIEDPDGKTEEFVINDETLKDNFIIYKADLNPNGIYDGKDNFIWLTSKEKINSFLWLEGSVRDNLEIWVRIKDKKRNIFKVMKYIKTDNAVLIYVKGEIKEEPIRLEDSDKSIANWLEKYSIFVEDTKNIDSNLDAETILDESQWLYNMELAKLERWMIFKYKNSDWIIALGVIIDIDNWIIKTKLVPDIEAVNWNRYNPIDIIFSWKEFMDVRNIGIYEEETKE